MAPSSMVPSTAVRVGVRIRPLTSQEINEGGRRVLQTNSNNSIGIGERKFTFDSVFDNQISQVELYESVAPPLLQSFVEGYNATIMAYGQTGSGKTFTMGSEAHLHLDTSGDTSSSGLIPRFMSDIFAKLAQKKEASDCQQGNNTQLLLDYHMSASFLEVYGEDVHDLLDSERQQHHRILPLREDSNGGVVVAGLKKRVVNNAQEALQVLHEGTLNRTTAATLMNLTSSRSHAVFTLSVTQQLRQSSASSSELDNMMDVTTTSRFTFVDLAGSERMKKTGAEGERAREGIKINEGLLALGNVINALSSESNKPVHVPYRQSKLTRLLQDALGGNSQTFFLACVSPSDTNASETLSTLHYANRARNIKNIPTKNVDAAALELQRLHTLSHVLQCELIKHRFHCKDDEHLGHVKDDLLKRSDVVDFLKSIQAVVDEHCGVKIAVTDLAPTSVASSITRALTPPRPLHEHPTSGKPSPLLAMGHLSEISPNRSILDKVGDILLEEVNPDEEMAILDQLLELQHQDHEYDKEHKMDEAILQQVEGELAEQEALLLQLRESLKVYHSMKEKFEILMSEVQQLESEKASLAVQLDKATADPTKGCSLAISKKLERVEQSLARARNEARKHQQMYRKAEQEAQKCRSLERKIHQLMQDRVQLMKKQSDATHRHREYTESKTREIMALKRKERTADMKMSKLHSQIQMHKKNLDKRNAYCAKLSDKLKQTEAHLTKLLTMRKRELDYRTDRRATTTGRWSRGIQRPNADDVQSLHFAPTTSEEVTARKFLLDKVINDRVQTSRIREEYEERLSAYGDVMREMVTEVNALNKARAEKSKSSEVTDLEHSIEDLELKLELLHTELDLLRSRMPDDDGFQDSQESKVKEVISSASSPVARRLLWDLMDRITECEMDRQKHERSLQLKDAALQSFESNAESLNNKVATLSSELAKAHALAEAKIDGLQMIRTLESEKADLENNLQSVTRERHTLLSQVVDMDTELKSVKVNLSEMKEKLVLAEAIVSQQDVIHPSKELLARVQEIWQDVGFVSTERDKASAQIHCCLDDTCKRLLEEASTLKASMQLELGGLQQELDHMNIALGTTSANLNDMSGTLAVMLERSRRHFNELQPLYQRARDRGSLILKHARNLQNDLGLGVEDLPCDLQTLLSSSFSQSGENPQITTTSKRPDGVQTSAVTELTNAVDGNTIADDSLPVESSGYLNEAFLSNCEHDITALRLEKSKQLVANMDFQKAANALAEEMHLQPRDIGTLASHIVQNRMEQMPEWWNVESLHAVSQAVVSDDRGLLQVNPSFTKHLEFVVDALTTIADVRRSLSSALKDAVEQAQKTLLNTVGGEFAASEAYSSFHEALFRLPQLSKEHIDACITELNALAAGVDTLTQSEIEALTIVWEALSVGSVERGKFWVKVDELTNTFEVSEACPFSANVELCEQDPDQWVFDATEKARITNKTLRKRLYKLELIHCKVEQLRTKQDRKSKIISLDSELRILNAKLDEFEEKKCSKQRLLTKKANSSTLLKEERFRKQMQVTFTSKLENLGGLLRSWRSEERESFDSHLLSDEVRSLLHKPQKTESLVEERTEFMHLRTVKSKAPGKKPVEISPTEKQDTLSSLPRTKSGLSPPRKRAAATPSNARKDDLATARKRYLAATESSRRFTRSAAAREAVESLLRQSPEKRKSEENAEDTIKPRKTRRVGDEIQTLLPMGQLPQAQPTKNRDSSTMLPFGHVLSRVSTQLQKENTEL